MDPFPRRSAYLSDWYYAYFLNAGLAAAAHFPPYQKREPARLGPNLFKTSGFLANYGSKAHDIGGLGRNDQSGCCGRHTLFNCGRSLRVPRRRETGLITPRDLCHVLSPRRPLAVGDGLKSQCIGSNIHRPLPATAATTARRRAAAGA
jgi:hypothetical protein